MTGIARVTICPGGDGLWDAAVQLPGGTAQDLEMLTDHDVGRLCMELRAELVIPLGPILIELTAGRVLDGHRGASAPGEECPVCLLPRDRCRGFHPECSPR